MISTKYNIYLKGLLRLSTKAISTMAKITVQNTQITVLDIEEQDYISLICLLPKRETAELLM